MMTATNALSVPEIREYCREVVDGLVIIRYRMRGPGESHWRPVEIVRVAGSQDR